MGMDAAHLPLLWLYSVCAIAVCGIGALALLAVFGTPGMLVVTLVFIGMAVPTAGATTPIEALPGFYRFLAESPDPGLGDDGRRPRGGRDVRLRHDRLVRPQGVASHPGRDETRENRRPGIAETAPAHPENRSVFILSASS